MQPPVELHKWVAQYNWDDGLAAIWPIVDDEETEFATALIIYWRMDGPWFESGASDEARSLHDTVADRLTSGFYKRQSLEYYPIEDNRLSKTQVFKLRKAGIPSELIEPEYPESEQTRTK